MCFFLSIIHLVFIISSALIYTTYSFHFHVLSIHKRSLFRAQYKKTSGKLRIESPSLPILTGINVDIRSNSLKLSSSVDTTATIEASTEEKSMKEKKELARIKAKESILRVIGARGSDDKPNSRNIGRKVFDPVLADPETKEPLYYTIPSSSLPSRRSSSFIIGDDVRSKNNNKISVTFQSDGSNDIYKGTSTTFYNLLNPSDRMKESIDESSGNDTTLLDNDQLLKTIIPFFPRQLTQTLFDGDYIPMRDLFTSPFVSFAYERGWRNSFAAAGFPGIDKEFELVKDFFQPAVMNDEKNVVVDMSCATGLMTRRLYKSKLYNRVIGCDYSDSMLTEARRRFNNVDGTSNKKSVELVQCDVANIPMQDGSINALHAGAAMHCWPDVQQGLNEIYRVLKDDGGRFFATTFLSSYFQNIAMARGTASGPQTQAFQYFSSIDELRSLLTNAGFDDKNVTIEILGDACVVMRCIK